ncbi:MAG: ribbon-helix-helix domain-containing protein [Actinomycetota bacterium]|nr:ribbon-helix-helix domain-containing protein [Actinomycetota bacterium]
MRRIQLHLEEELDEALAARAREEKISKAALIRRYLRSHVTIASPAAEDPSALLVGIYEGDRQDSASIDDVVYGT